MFIFGQHSQFGWNAFEGFTIYIYAIECFTIYTGFTIYML